MKQIRIVLVGASPYNGNRGVGALTYSTLLLLHKIAKLNDYEINIFLISTGNKKGNDQLIIGNNKIKFVNAQPISVFSIKELLKLLIIPQSRKTLKELIKSDFILNIGAGDSFSDIYGKNRFNSINNQHRMARLLNKKYALLPQTIGPYNDKNVQKQANKTIEKSDIVFARDFQSFKYVTENTNQKNVFESIDVAFFMPYKKQKFSTDYIHVGINVSALLWHGGYNRNNQFGLKCNYQELIHDIIRYFLTLPNVKIHIVPHVVDQDASIENDYEVSYHLVNEYYNEHILLAPFFLTPILAKNYIAGLDFFAGARMHSTIAAFSSGVPVFPMAYSRKFNGLFIDTLDYKYMGDMVNEEKEDILDGIKECFEKREELALIIQERMNTIVKERENLLVEKLAKALGLM